MVLKVEQVLDFGKVKDVLMKLILMVGSTGILDTGKEEEVKMLKDRLADGKELLVDLLVL